MDFSRFDQTVDVEGLKADIETAANRVAGDYPEIPLGTYEVSVEKLELTESKKGDPMVSAWFKLQNSEYKDNLIFMNQVVLKGFQIHIVNKLLREMGTDLDIHFESYSAYAHLLTDVFNAVKNKKHFALKYGESKNGFKTFDITEVYNL